MRCVAAPEVWATIHATWHPMIPCAAPLTLAGSTRAVLCQMQRGRDETKAVQEEVRVLRNWVMSDVLSKLQA